VTHSQLNYVLELLGKMTRRLETHVHVDGTAKRDLEDLELLAVARATLEVVTLDQLLPMGVPIGISGEEVDALRHAQALVTIVPPQLSASDERQWRLTHRVLDRLIASATGGAIVYPVAEEAE
jgi:hypothetical protein